MRTLQSLARIVGGELVGGDAAFGGVTIDTRRLEAGDLFLALPGRHSDGHDHIERAKALGAAGAVVNHAVGFGLPQVVVSDVQQALAHYARIWRRHFDIPVVAVTGSNGKTTVKQMLHAIFAEQGGVLATAGNYNNELGVPLTLLRLRAVHRAAVLELGANHPGEIARLTELCTPTAGIITMAGAAHLEGFGSVEGVAHAKGELFQGLNSGSLAVINADDDYAGLWSGMAARCRVLRFGESAGCDVTFRAESIVRDAQGSEFELVTPDWRAPVSISLPGEHNMRNALAAAACAYGVGVEQRAIVNGLARARGEKGRLAWYAGPRGSRILDDSYNANPDSLDSALKLATARGARCWLVLGEMSELGAETAQRHAQAGAQARGYGVARLYTTGEATRAAVKAFGEGARHFADRTHLVQALLAELEPGVVVLVKGSRSQQLEQIVRRLFDESGEVAARAANGD